MFDIRIKIRRIDYEKTMMALLPMALEKCRDVREQNMLIRLFLELDGDAVPVLLGLMEQMPGEVRQELLCQCINSYRTRLALVVRMGYMLAGRKESMWKVTDCGRLFCRSGTPNMARHRIFLPCFGKYDVPANSGWILHAGCCNRIRCRDGAA